MTEPEGGWMQEPDGGWPPIRVPQPPPLRFDRGHRPRRRRRFPVRAGATALLAMIVVLTAGTIEQSHAARRRRHHVARSPSPATPTDPLTTASMKGYIASRSGRIAVAVDNLDTGKTDVYHPGVREQTASIVKVDILETLLRQAMVSHTPLSGNTVATAQGMIENSDNDDATDLYNQVGGGPSINAYNNKAGLTNTSVNDAGYWGLTLTSAPDQVTLLKQLVDQHGLLDSGSQRFQLGLMSNIEADQQWGVSGGVPSTAAIALKNGWLPLTGSDWQVNSIGRIRGDGRWYLIAVLTDNEQTEAYGIDTIEGISSRVWQSLKPKP